MDIVSIIYEYINDTIDSNELIDGFEKLDLTKYSKKELLEIKNIKENIKKIKENTNDSQKLYKEISTVLTQNKLIRRYINDISDKEFLKFITNDIDVNDIDVSYVIALSQEKFNNLVKCGIKDDARELIWRLAVNYQNENLDFSLIENYFIEKKDVFYITELISCAPNGINMEKIISKIKNTNDKKFIDEVLYTLYKMGIKYDGN